MKLRMPVFPDRLRGEIDKLTAMADVSALAGDAGKLSSRYRHESGCGKRLLTEEREALAYAAVRMPATFGAVAKALDYALDAVDFVPKTVLDIGAGTGAAGWAAESLINLDSLNENVETTRKQREELVQKGQRMIEEAIGETREWLATTGVDETIASLQQRCTEIVEDSYAYLNRKLDLSTRDQKIVKKILKASLKRLIREPILELKQTESKEQQEQYKKVLQDLFQFDTEIRE